MAVPNCKAAEGDDGGILTGSVHILLTVHAQISFDAS